MRGRSPPRFQSDSKRSAASSIQVRSPVWEVAHTFPFGINDFRERRLVRSAELGRMRSPYGLTNASTGMRRSIRNNRKSSRFWNDSGNLSAEKLLTPSSSA